MDSCPWDKRYFAKAAVDVADVASFASISVELTFGTKVSDSSKTVI